MQHFIYDFTNGHGQGSSPYQEVNFFLLKLDKCKKCKMTGMTTVSWLSSVQKFLEFHHSSFAILQEVVKLVWIVKPSHTKSKVL